MRSDSHNPLVSVILPVYNGEKYLETAISSIVFQSHTSWELLIGDDASTDSTFEVIKKFEDKRIKKFRNPENVGSLRTRNFLFKRAKGKLIALQDADDFSEKNRFEEQIRFILDSKTKLCGTWARYFKGNKVLFEKKTPVNWEEIKRTLPFKNPFCSASIMFDREILNDLSGYRDYFFDKGNYDYDFTSRIAERYPSINLPHFLYNVRILKNSNSKQTDFEHPIKLESHKLVQYFIMERSENQKDALDENNYQLLKDLEKKLLEPYRRDPLLAYDKRINLLLDLKFYSQAITESIQILYMDRLSLKSIKLFLYSLKRVFIRN